MLGRAVTRSSLRFGYSARKTMLESSGSVGVLFNGQAPSRSFQPRAVYRFNVSKACEAVEVELAEKEPTTETIKKEIPKERRELLESLFLKSGASDFDTSITCEHLQQTLVDIVEGQHDSVTQQIIEKV